jgi:predicted ATPase
MITSYSSHNKKYELLPPGYIIFPGANSFTVIVGKNGTGKSRLLQAVVTQILGDDISSDLFDREDRVGPLFSARKNIEFTKPPEKIICVSTSPFDKFPILRRGVSSQLYSYLGLRGLPSHNLSIAYMSRIIASLTRAIWTSPIKAQGITDVLHYLGYDGTIHCTFTLALSNRIFTEILEAPDPINAVSGLKPQHFPTLDGVNLAHQILTLSAEEVLRLIKIASEYKQASRKPRFDLYIDSHGLNVGDIAVDDFLALVSTGFAKLRNVSLRKKEQGEGSGSFRMSEASSGEQSVVMGLLGIASQIEDNSLICIDEPEVCLHPEWQERYVHLLIDTFSNRRNCQFIIATHSPQVVAELPNANCFVMNMADGRAIDARTFSHRSIDFQLASVFKTPGHHNEFLNRTAINLFARISKEKCLSASDESDLMFLNDLFGTVKIDDPLRELITALNQMKDVYGRDS